MTTYDDDMPIYISIYDKKKPRKAHALTCTLTVEEKRQRACNIAKKHYYNHREEINAKHALYREIVKSKKTKNETHDNVRLSGWSRASA